MVDCIEETTADEAQQYLDELEIMLTLADHGYKPEAYKKVIQRMKELNLTHKEAIERIKTAK